MPHRTPASWRVRVIVCVTLLAVSVQARAQQWLDRPGEIGTETAIVGAAKLRMPPGHWELVVDRVINGSYNSFDQKMYMQIEEQHVVAMLEVNSNEHPAIYWTRSGRSGFRPTGDCGRRDVFFNGDFSNNTGDFDCLSVTHSELSRRGGVTPSHPLWGPVLNRAGSLGGLPRPMIYANFNKSDRSGTNYIQVYVFVNPALAGFAGNKASWEESEWHKDNLDSRHTDFLNKVVTWAQYYRKIVASSLP